jgi:hypothetical protein
MEQAELKPLMQDLGSTMVRLIWTTLKGGYQHPVEYPNEDTLVMQTNTIVEQIFKTCFEGYSPDEEIDQSSPEAHTRFLLGAFKLWVSTAVGHRVGKNPDLTPMEEAVPLVLALHKVVDRIMDTYWPLNLVEGDAHEPGIGNNQ